jgi:hypothetical protein
LFYNLQFPVNKFAIKVSAGNEGNILRNADTANVIASFLATTFEANKNNNKKTLSLLLALIETASPDLEKQGFFAVVFVNRE